MDGSFFFVAHKRLAFFANSKTLAAHKKRRILKREVAEDLRLFSSCAASCSALLPHAKLASQTIDTKTATTQASAYLRRELTAAYLLDTSAYLRDGSVAATSERIPSHSECASGSKGRARNCISSAFLGFVSQYLVAAEI